jgi:hypothetical protein
MRQRAALVFLNRLTLPPALPATQQCRNHKPAKPLCTGVSIMLSRIPLITGLLASLVLLAQAPAQASNRDVAIGRRYHQPEPSGAGL